jgi:hypothetical protein
VYTPHPITYLSVCVPGFPNWFQALGPNSAFGSGSQLVVIERQIEYAIKATLKLQREGLKSSLYRNATYDLQTHYFPLALFPDGQCYLHNSAPAASHLFTLQTVYSEKCRSWYKMGKDKGRVAGLWPGV